MKTVEDEQIIHSIYDDDDDFIINKVLDTPYFKKSFKIQNLQSTELSYCNSLFIPTAMVYHFLNHQPYVAIFKH